MILRLSLDLPEDQSYLRLTRTLGAATLEYLNVVTQDIEDIKTVLDELAANVIRHAKSAEGRFHLTLEYHAEMVVVAVEDQGKGFTFADLPPPGTVRSDSQGGERLGGYGPSLVGALTDRLTFYRTDEAGTTVRAEKRLTFETHADAEQAARMSEEDGPTITAETA